MVSGLGSPEDRGGLAGSWGPLATGWRPPVPASMEPSESLGTGCPKLGHPDLMYPVFQWLWPQAPELMRSQGTSLGDRAEWTSSRVPWRTQGAATVLSSLFPCPESCLSLQVELGGETKSHLRSERKWALPQLDNSFHLELNADCWT